MDTIYKFPLVLTDRQTIFMPRGARVITAMKQNDNICVWAEVTTTEPTEARVFWILGTGNPRPAASLRHISSVKAAPFVWHVYEEPDVSKH